jgi:HAE1 family hydrophobic/amphiphilic exporter-1
MIRERDVVAEAHPELREQLGIRSTWLTAAFDKVGGLFHSLDESYRKRLEWAIHHRVPIIGIAVLAVGAAGALWPFVGRENLPQTDTGNLSINVKLPLGASLDTTDAAMKQVDTVLAKDPDVDCFISGSGFSFRSSGGSQSTPNNGGATVQLKASRKSKTAAVVMRLQKELATLPGAKIQVTPFDVVANIIGGNNLGLTVDVFGNDLTLLAKTSADVQAALDSIPGLTGVDTSLQDSTPEIHFAIDRAKAQTLGVSFQDIANTLTDSTNGDLSTYYQENGFQYPIMVQVPQTMRLSVSQLNNLPIAGTENRPSGAVLISQVATAVVGTGPREIERQNSQRYNDIGGQVVGRSQSDVMADITTAMNKIQFPTGSYWQFSADQLQAQQDFAGLGVSVFLAVALIYMLLATQFESFVYPLVVLCSVPLCAIGMVLALFLTGRAFGLTAFIGLLMLIGIVVKNGILLVDYTNQLRQRGVERDLAVLTAAPTRLRPILMTTLAAILGMLPLALGIGTGSEMYVPLATTVIGGLATSTMLTLFVVPTVYTLFDDLIVKFRRPAAPIDDAAVAALALLPGGESTEFSETHHAP